MSLYMWLNLLSVSIPLIATFDKRIKFNKTWMALGPSLLLSATIFIIWDVYFTQWGVWGFNPDHLSGIYLFNLPLEEWIFFITIPYATVFTYHCVKIFIKKSVAGSLMYRFTIILALLLIVTGIINYSRLYTSITFISAGTFIYIHLFFFKNHFLKDFLISYAIIYLFPFMLVNGALTGAFTAEPVVWYNDLENLALRIITIPIEDFVYGFLLFLMNVTLYEGLLNKKTTAFLRT